MTIAFDSRHNPRRDALPAVPLSALRKELGVGDGKDSFELKQRLIDLAAKCDARFSPESAFFLPEDDKGLKYTWHEIKAKLALVPQDLLMPTLQVSNEKDPKEPQLLGALSQKCEGLHELSNRKDNEWEGTIPEKISFAWDRVRKGADVSSEERQLLAMCQHQLRIFQEGKRAFISGPELELINDFWKFKEEFESFTAPPQLRPPVPQLGPEYLGRSTFKWVLEDGHLLPTQKSEFVNSTVLDLSSRYFKGTKKLNEENLRAAQILEEYFRQELTRETAIGKIEALFIFGRKRETDIDIYRRIGSDAFDHPGSVDEVRVRSWANIQILSRFEAVPGTKSPERRERLLAVVKELKVIYPPPPWLVALSRSSVPRTSG